MATIHDQPVSSPWLLQMADRAGTKRAMDRNAERAEREARAARLRWARAHAGHSSPRKAAAVNGWNPNTYRAHDSGANGFDNAAGKTYANRFRVDFAWLMTGHGITPEGFTQSSSPTKKVPPAGEEAMIPVIGVVKAGGIIDYSQAGSLGQAPTPPDDGEWKVLRIEGKAYPPTYQDGHILYYRAAKFSPDQAVNQECVVSVSGGTYVRNVMRGSDPNRWHLTAPNYEPMLNQTIEWVSPVVWVKKAEVQTV